jgi:hypothetical protein
MENKEFRNAFIAAVKNELKDFTQVQRNLKKSRKEEFRPKDKEGCYGLQEIVDEINNNAAKISQLIFYYRWVRHGLKYWTNRGINNFKEFKFLKINDKGFDSEDWYYKNWDTLIDWGVNKGKTHGQVLIEHAKNYYIKKSNQYGIEVSEGNINYLIQNI